MYRVDDPTRSVDELGAGKDGYTESTPGGTPTAIRADHLNALQEEIANVVEGAGTALVKADSTQLLAAVRTLIGIATERTGITDWVDLTAGVADDINDVEASSTTVNVLVAVGALGAIRRNDIGESWSTPAADAAYADEFRAVCWYPAGGLFIACGEGDEIQTSPTGNTWTRRETGGDDFNACAAGLAFAACVGDNGTIKTTANGTSFTLRTSAHAGVSMKDVCYSPTLDLMVAVGDAASVQRSNASGSTWTAAADVTIMTGSPDLNCVVWSEEQQLFFASTTTTNRVFKSVDGSVWQAATGIVTLSGGDILGIAALPQQLAVFGTYMVSLYPYTELDGTPAPPLEQWLFDAGLENYNDPLTRFKRIPTAADSPYAGRILACGPSGPRICASRYFG